MHIMDKSILFPANINIFNQDAENLTQYVFLFVIFIMYVHT